MTYTTLQSFMIVSRGSCFKKLIHVGWMQTFQYRPKTPHLLQIYMATE